jgi:hypothetical protein
MTSFDAAGVPDPARVTVKDVSEVVNSNQEKDLPTLTPFQLGAFAVPSVPRFCGALQLLTGEATGSTYRSGWPSPSWSQSWLVQAVRLDLRVR